MTHGVELYNAVHTEFQVDPYYVIGKGHNDLDYNFGPLLKRLNDFLDEYLPQYRKKGRRLNKIVPSNITKMELSMMP